VTCKPVSGMRCRPALCSLLSRCDEPVCVASRQMSLWVYECCDLRTLYSVQILDLPKLIIVNPFSLLIPCNLSSHLCL
jgi:hypothetical protein